MRSRLSPAPGFLLPALLGLVLLLSPESALADVQAGLDSMSSVSVPQGSFRSMVENSVGFLTGFLALGAFVAVVAAGFVFVLGIGSEGAITRGRKMIIFALLGVAVVFFASVIVSFFTVDIPGAF